VFGQVIDAGQRIRESQREERWTVEDFQGTVLAVKLAKPR
jgi:hypothetical protein